LPIKARFNTADGRKVALLRGSLVRSQPSTLVANLSRLNHDLRSNTIRRYLEIGGGILGTARQPNEQLLPGARFHPIEILLSMGLKLGLVAALGAPAVAVLIFEVLLNATAMFNHSNVHMPAWVDGVLRWVVVTPDMHRVHHSILARETNSNFGFNLPWWDRLFGTYRAQPTAGHDAMIIGIEQFREPREQRLERMLTQPFRDDDHSYALGRREPAE
jgi:hypothetical protein